MLKRATSTEKAHAALATIGASTWGITIDRAIGAPGHGKDVVDVLA
jgi:hypothetical protein